MLEDDFTDVLGKALASRQLGPAEAAAAAGIPERAVRAFQAGKFDPDTARRLAPVLGLDADAFATHADYRPQDPALPEIIRLDLPFGGGQVNAWLIVAGDQSLLIDAGFDVSHLLGALDRHFGRMPDRVFITHAHRDHLGAVDKLLGAGLPVHAAGIAGCMPLQPGDRVRCGSLVVKARDLSGHAVPSLGYEVEGLSLPVLATGDALFAGSIGGCANPELYRHALQRLRGELAGLPDETALLPGHGPATTLGQERLRNPFLSACE